MAMNRRVGATILLDIMVAVLVSVLCKPVYGRTDWANEATEEQQVSTQTQGASDTAKKSADQAQKAAADAQAAAANASKKAAQAAASAGVALNGSTNVKDNVNAQVVLLPRKQAERVFSKEIARHYAVVQVTINNRSKDAAFVLHSIFVDYSHWALSGMTPNEGNACDQASDNSQATSCPGQVASVESRVIRGELLDASTWTWRNGIVRAVVLVGTVASAIPAFHSTNALKYVGDYNGQFVPGLQIFWPDGTVGQLNRVSDFGFQTNKIIAKENSDIVYAFFPIDRFLTPGMRNIFMNAPALFFAPAQLFVDKHIGGHCWKPGICLSQSDVDEMKTTLEKMAYMAVEAGCQAASSKAFCDANHGPTIGKDGQLKNEEMLALLTLPCGAQDAQGKQTAQGDQATQTGQQPAQPEAKLTEAEAQIQADCQVALPVQHIIERVSLNSINVLVQGAMTVDVTTVPATITDVVFDKGNNSPDVWEETTSSLNATISGRFLTGGVPSVTAIDLPDGSSAKIEDYFDPKTVSVASDQSSDTTLPFKLQWKNPICPGSKLHFQVTKTDPKDPKKTPVKSMDFILAVNYVPTKPALSSNIQVDNGGSAATWKAGSTVTGTLPGCGLDGATSSIPKITVPGVASAAVGDYINTATIKADAAKTSDASNLHFTMPLKKDIPTGSTLTFQAVSGTGDKAVTSNTKDYSVSFK